MEPHSFPLGYEPIKKGEVIPKGSLSLTAGVWSPSWDIGKVSLSEFLDLPRIKPVSRKDTTMTPNDVKRLVDECAMLANAEGALSFKMNGRNIPAVTNSQYMIGAYNSNVLELLLAENPEINDTIASILNEALESVNALIRQVAGQAIARKSEEIAAHFAPKAKAVCAIACPLMEAYNAASKAQ